MFHKEKNSFLKQKRFSFYDLMCRVYFDVFVSIFFRISFLDGKERQEGDRGQRNPAFIANSASGMPVIKGNIRIQGSEVIIFRQSCHGDETRMAEGLPEEGRTLPAEHDDLGVVLTKSKASSELVVKLSPVVNVVLAKARSVLKDALNLKKLNSKNRMCRFKRGQIR